MLILAVHYHEVVTVQVIQATGECEVERSFGWTEKCLEGFVLHLSYNAPINDIPHSPSPGLDGEIASGDLTEYHVKSTSPGALPDVNTPSCLSPRIDRGLIGDLT